MEFHNVAWAAFAYILDGKVQNVGAYYPNEYGKASYVAKAIHGDDAIAVDVTYIPVDIEDEYEDGMFYRNVTHDDGTTTREQVEPYQTEAGRVSELEAKGAMTTESINSIELALIELYESEDEEA